MSHARPRGADVGDRAAAPIPVSSATSQVMLGDAVGAGAAALTPAAVPRPAAMKCLRLLHDYRACMAQPY